MTKQVLNLRAHIARVYFVILYNRYAITVCSNQQRLEFPTAVLCFLHVAQVMFAFSDNFFAIQ